MTREQAVETLRALQANINEKSAPKSIQAIKFAIKTIHRFEDRAATVSANRERMRSYGHDSVRCRCAKCVSVREMLARIKARNAQYERCLGEARMQALRDSVGRDTGAGE